MKKWGIRLSVLALLVITGGVFAHFYFGIPAQPTNGSIMDPEIWTGKGLEIRYTKA